MSLEKTKLIGLKETSPEPFPSPKGFVQQSESQVICSPQLKKSFKMLNSSILCQVLAFLTLIESRDVATVCKLWNTTFETGSHWKTKIRGLISSNLYPITTECFFEHPIAIDNLKNEYIRHRKIFEIKPVEVVPPVELDSLQLGSKTLVELNQQILTGVTLYFIGNRYQLGSFEDCIVKYDDKFYKLMSETLVGLSIPEETPFDFDPLVHKELLKLIQLRLTNRKVFVSVLYLFHILMSKNHEIIHIGNTFLVEKPGIFKVSAESQDEHLKMELEVTERDWRFDIHEKQPIMYHDDSQSE
jgi:hypothetical protein